MRKRVWVLALLGTALILTGCLGGGGTDGYGTLELSITDAPTNDIEQAWVSVSKVTAHNTEQGWFTIKEFPEGEELEIDLLTLRFDEQLLGKELLPAGKYTEIRLKIDEAWVISGDGQKDFKIPSGEESGIKIKHNFTINSGQVKVLVMDVNLLEFIRPHQDGYMMNPTAIKVLDKLAANSVNGHVGILVDGKFVPYVDGDVVLKIYQGETLISSSLALRSDENGHLAGYFQFNAVPAGDYRLVAEVYDGDILTWSAETSIVVDLENNELEENIILKPVEI